MLKFDEQKQIDSVKGALALRGKIEEIVDQICKDGFKNIVSQITQKQSSDKPFKYYDTICRQVANRIPNIREFAQKHDLILFVCGKKSSNGRVLFEECCKVNPNSKLVSNVSEIKNEWLQNTSSIGICGATSTPKWLMEEVFDYLQSKL